MGGVAECEIEVVEHRNQREIAGFVKAAAKVEHLELVGDVQVRGRFVEKEKRGLLRQHERDPGALALASGEAVDRAVGQLERPSRSQCGVDGGVVLRRPLPEERLVGKPPAGDEVAHRDAVGRV